MTSARLDAFARGAVWALAASGFDRLDIPKQVSKTDGTNPTTRAVDAVLAKKRANLGWRGHDSQAGGRPRALTKDQRKQLVSLGFKFRGRAVVTSAFCKRRLRFLREVCDQTIRNELQAAGLKWLHRRRKTNHTTSLW